MKKLLLIMAVIGYSSLSLGKTIYDFKYKDTDGKPLDFAQFKGKTLVIANIATKCGFTGQLDDLEKVYNTYKEKGLVVIGIPSNNFLSQTPEDNKDVGNFCRLKYGVKFPITEKVDVIGDNKTEVIKWINEQKGYEGTILWNFEKFIVNKKGEVVDRFRSKTDPSDKDFIAAVEKALK